ncbi:MAG: TetR/AcrR family transcriptional regulator [Actinomycetota bacterium]|nr:TetR/AcrR family transcriptional regulator [Actinomycetota bacterium]
MSTRQSPIRARSGLSRDAILEGALSLVEREGLDALSMRRLAQDLDVGTMTLYGYFRDKRELLDGLVDALAARAPLPRLRGDWRQRLTTLMRHLATTLAAYPALAQLRLAQPIVTPGAFQLTEAGMATLREAGFSAADAARHFRALFLYAFAIAVFSPAGTVADARRQAAGALASLPPADFPALAESLVELVDSLDPSAQFEHGLALLLDGIEASRRVT